MSQERRNGRETLDLPIPVKGLSTETIASLIQYDLLDIEMKLYGESEPLQAFNKLSFLVESDDYDFPETRNPRVDRITFAMYAISNHFKYGEKDFPPVLSSMADIFYGLVQLQRLDPEFEKEYKKCLSRISESLGFSVRESLLLAFAKYKHRLIDNQGQKAIKQEEALIAMLIEPTVEGEKPLLPKPLKENLVSVYPLINSIRRDFLQPRLLQIKALSNL